MLQRWRRRRVARRSTTCIVGAVQAFVHRHEHLEDQRARAFFVARDCLVARSDEEPVIGVLKSGKMVRPDAQGTPADSPKMGPDAFEFLWLGFGRRRREIVMRDSEQGLEVSASGGVRVGKEAAGEVVSVLKDSIQQEIEQGSLASPGRVIGGRHTGCAC